MAWSTPRVWVSGELVTAVLMNTYVSANDSALRAGGLAVTSQAANDILYASSATQLTRSAKLKFDGTKLTVTGTASGASAASNSLVVLDHNDNTTLNILSGTGGGGFIDFGDSGDSDIGRITYIHTTNYMSFTTNAAEQMRITSAGYLGIGVTNPAFYVTAVNGDAGAQYTINSTHATYTGSALKVGAVRAASSAYNLIYTATGTAAGGSSGTASFVVRGDGQTTIIGNLGVGTTSVKATAHVKAPGNNWEDGILLEHDSGDTGWDIHPENNAANSLFIGYNADTSVGITAQTATTVLALTSAGDVGVGTTAPGTAVAADKMIHSVNCIRAWGKVNATSGTPTFVDGFNFTVGAIASPAEGKALVTFITALPDANYVVVFGFCDNYPKFAVVQSESTTSFEVWTFSSLEDLEDLEWTFAVISD